ncbi:bifunctional diguanylate cyclase/phosphodiesterase [Nocardioides sambongensis]|uniref:bifunctional diguanylate cyclase/phosphodiesterase n=1 Tax=Nocardioides sambongensis TaxID=2589074 RepID=UPI0015E87486|nr:EAL domain-containing protein [Nocardioides sambongensis]
MSTVAEARRSGRRVLALTAGFSVLYAIAMLVGRSTHVEPSQLSVVFPGAGVGVVWALVTRSRAELLVAMTALVLVSGVINQVSGVEPVGGWLFGLVNAANAVVGAWICRRVGGGRWPRPVVSVTEVSALAAASLAGAAVSAFTGGVVARLRFGDDLWDGIGLIGFRNALSTYVLAAALLAAPRVPALWAAHRRRALPAVTVALVVSASLMALPWPITYVLIPALVLVALRCGPEITALVVAAQGVLVVAATSQGHGPFGDIADPAVRVLVAQGLVVVLAVVGTAVAVTQRGRERALAASRADRDRLHNHMEAALVSSAHVVVDEDGGRRAVAVNPSLAALTGRAREELLGTDPATWLVADSARLMDAGTAALRDAAGTAGWRSQLRLDECHGGGWVDAALSLVEHDPGEAGRDREPATTEFHLQMVDITAQRDAEVLLAHAALHDDLTGLANRALWADRLDAALLAGRRGGGRVAAMYVDVDRFKSINDTYGHVVGDEVLKVIAHRIGEVAGPGRTVARLGGDEFAVLCPAVTDQQETAALADALQRAVRPDVVVGDRHVRVEVSIGIALTAPGEADDRHLLRHADTALYAAKQNGRSRSELYSAELESEVDRESRVLADLERGFGADELVVHYQPIVDARSREIVALEALLRWQHPDRGLLEPEEFIDVLEGSDLVHDVGAQVLTRACCDAAELAAGGCVVPVHVNVCAPELARPGYVGTVRSALAASGLPPELLVLEITETRLITVTGSLRRDLLEVREMGVQLAVDDFGTGYSALTHLVDLPVGIVKIDRSFVAEVATSRSAHAVCSGVRAMADGLGIRAVAEGVEREEQAEILAALGYDQLQGFGYGRPAPLDRLGLLVSRAG